MEKGMKKTFLALGAAALFIGTSAFAEGHTEIHWDYDAHGPAHWCDFSAVCKDGKAQSPINIVTKETIPLMNDNVLNLNEDTHVQASIVDNGHAIQVNTDHAGKLTIHGTDFNLVQFHLHGKSEENINGKQYDLVAHMVHKSADGKLAVVAVLFEEGKSANVMLDKVINNVGKTVDLDPQDLLPKDKEHYFHFMGSLTTPPCSENVNWYVMKEVQSVTKDQLASIRKYYDHNFRPVQPLNGRKVESK